MAFMGPSCVLVIDGQDWVWGAPMFSATLIRTSEREGFVDKSSSEVQPIQPEVDSVLALENFSRNGMS